MPRIDRQSQRHPIPVLDRVLAGWEDFWFLLGIMNQLFAPPGRDYLCSPVGAFVNWQRFRQFLLTLHKTGKDPTARATMEDFLAPKDLSPELERQSLHYWFPTWLLSWSAHSRRLYQLCEDLELVLRATSLQSVRWKDVRFPFPAFALALAKPIFANNGRQFDFITVLQGPHELNTGDKRNLVVIQAYARKCHEYSPLSHQDKDVLKAASRNPKRRTWLKLNGTKLLTAAANSLSGGSSRIILQIDDLRETTVLETFKPEREDETDLDEDIAREAKIALGEIVVGEDIDLSEHLVRLVVGFSLYLQSLPPGSRHVSNPDRKPLRSGLPDRRSIVSEADVCTVASVYELTAQEREVLGGEGEAPRRAQYELGWHFREGHWRRQPGLGHDPNAPRSVHVRPTIVRRDRMPDEGGLPGGAQKTV